MKNIADFFKSLGAGFLAIVAVAIIAALAGVNFRLLMALVIIFAIAKLFKGPLGSVLRVIPILLLVFALFTAYFPLSKNKIKVTIADADITISSHMSDKLATQVDYIRLRHRDTASAKFLRVYDSLLNVDDIKGAEIAYQEFKKKWNIKGKDRFESSKDKEIVSDSSASQVSNGKHVYDPTLNRAIRCDHGYYTLDLKINEESEWIQIPCGRAYDFEPKDCSFSLYYSDGTVVNSWDGVRWPSKPIFKIKNWTDTPVTLKVI